MIRPRVRAVCVPALMAFLLAGCGETNAPTNDRVEGTVTLDNVPLPGVRVEFVPDAKPGVKAPLSSAFTDEKGRYSLTHGKNRPGAAIGKHFVVVIQGRSQGGDDREARVAAAAATVPRVYALANQTPLVVEVTKEQHVYDLMLSRAAEARK
jgi:hypothetical protein